MLAKNDDKAFDNYVDHNAPDIDPTAYEIEKLDDMVVSDVNSLDSSLCNEFDMPMRKRKRKLPKFDDFRPNTGLTNLIFTIATKKGFIDALRPVVGLDTCHMKGQHVGPLLSVVSVDPNNGMYPIAYAVAEVESYET
ncbi:unnamed protein product [Prunus brigantina]